jgi:hypothetical protein
LARFIAGLHPRTEETELAPLLFFVSPTGGAHMAGRVLSGRHGADFLPACPQSLSGIHGELVDQRGAA